MYSILPKLREDMQLRGFSKHTIRSYTECVTEYLSLLNKPLSATIANTASTRPSARSKPATSKHTEQLRKTAIQCVFPYIPLLITMKLLQPKSEIYIYPQSSHC